MQIRVNSDPSVFMSVAYHRNYCATRVLFLLFLSCNYQLSQNFHRFVYFLPISCFIDWVSTSSYVQPSTGRTSCGNYRRHDFHTNYNKSGFLLKRTSSATQWRSRGFNTQYTVQQFLEFN